MRRQSAAAVEQESAAFDFTSPPPFFHPGQLAAWEVHEQISLLLCGRQSGKTTIGPFWLLREIQRRGPGDYAIVVPDLVLGGKKVQPFAEQVLCRDVNYGKAFRYSKSENLFTLTENGLKVLFGTDDIHELYRRYRLEDPETGQVEMFDLFPREVRIVLIPAKDSNKLESATFKAIWFDEAGQAGVPEASYEACLGRLMFYGGRLLLTTTPYMMNWLKYKVYDFAKKHPSPEGANPLIEAQGGGYAVVNFPSSFIPSNRKMLEKMRASMPAWRYELFYEGKFTRPEGLIFAFDKQRNIIPPVRIPQSLTRFFGIDFGPMNFACTKVAICPKSKRAIVYQTYHPGRAKQTTDHVASVLLGEPRTAYAEGGAPSEDGWRLEFQTAGLPINKPTIKDHEARIQVLYSLVASGRLVVCEHLQELIRSFETYQRVIMPDGSPSHEIENRNTYHVLDALLYIADMVRHALNVSIQELFDEESEIAA